MSGVTLRLLASVTCLRKRRHPINCSHHPCEYKYSYTCHVARLAAALHKVPMKAECAYARCLQVLLFILCPTAVSSRQLVIELPNYLPILLEFCTFVPIYDFKQLLLHSHKLTQARFLLPPAPSRSDHRMRIRCRSALNLQESTRRPAHLVILSASHCPLNTS